MPSDAYFVQMHAHTATAESTAATAGHCTHACLMKHKTFLFQWRAMTRAHACHIVAQHNKDTNALIHNQETLLRTRAYARTRLPYMLRCAGSL